MSIYTKKLNAIQYFLHGICRLLLHRRGDVGIGIQGEPRGVMPQHTGDGLDIYAVLESQGGESVSKVVEPHLGQPCPFQDPVEHMEDAVRGDGATCGRRKYIFAVALFFLLY